MIIQSNPLKANINKEYIAKFDINDCFEYFTYKPTVFAHYYDRSA